MRNPHRTPSPIVLAVLIFLAIYCVFPVTATPETSAGPSIRLFFSPNGGGTEAIISEIRHARSEVLVQAYSFTPAPIAKALLDARKRRVKVTVILDKSQRNANYSAADFLRNSGIATHNSLSIMDTGSYPLRGHWDRHE